MQFLKCVKVALLVSGAAFTVASLPAAKFANERVDIQLNRDHFFSGEARDFSGAYLSIAGLVSASLGVASFSLAAWRQTGNRLEETKLTIAELESLIQQREQQLQAAQLAPAKLQQVGLDQFLDDDFPLASALPQKTIAQGAPRQRTAVANAARVQPPVPVMNRNTARPVQERQQLSAAQVSQLQAVQAQLQQQSQATRKPQSYITNPAPLPREVGRSTGGFTVINPYQVQSAPQPSRQSNNGSKRGLA